MVGFFLSISVVVAFFFAIVIASVIGSKERPKISNKTVLELNLGFEVLDRVNEEDGALLALLGEEKIPIGLDKILWGFDKAATDDHVKGVLLRPDLYSGGFATAKEIHDKILEFRKSGKFVYSYGDFYTEKGYFIASACDSVFLNPKGMAELNGLAANVVMYKGMLDKMGVKVEVFKAGTHKGAVEPFIMEQLSDNNRTQIKNYVTGIFNTMATGIAKARKLDKSKVRSNMNEFKAQNAQLAVDYGFMDGLKYEDEMLEICKRASNIKKKNFKTSSFQKYSSANQDLGSGSNQIAVVFAEGEIGMGEGDLETGIYCASLVKELKKVRLNDNIKALVLRVNSPGGSSNASDIISREINLIRKIKPVIVSFGNVAASGGYYISCLADSIFAQPNTITGSIGVFAMMANTRDLYKEKLGLGYETIETGEYASFGRPDRGLNEKQRIFLQNTVDMIYDDFVGIVARGRGMKVSEIKKIAEGQVYTGTKALELGLVDGLGGLQDAIKAASFKADLKEYRLLMMPRMKSVFGRFLGGSKQIKINAVVPTYFKSTYKELNKVQRLIKNPVQGMMMMPYSLEIN